MRNSEDHFKKKKVFPVRKSNECVNVYSLWALVSRGGGCLNLHLCHFYHCSMKKSGRRIYIVTNTLELGKDERKKAILFNTDDTELINTDALRYASHTIFPLKLKTKPKQALSLPNQPTNQPTKNFPLPLFQFLHSFFLTTPSPQFTFFTLFTYSHYLLSLSPLSPPPF